MGMKNRSSHRAHLFANCLGILIFTLGVESSFSEEDCKSLANNDRQLITEPNFVLHVTYYSKTYGLASIVSSSFALTTSDPIGGYPDREYEVPTSEIRLFYGPKDVFVDEENTPWIPVAKVHIHPRYIHNVTNYNLILLELKMKTNILPVKLPKVGDAVPPIDTNCFFYGWLFQKPGKIS